MNISENASFFTTPLRDGALFGTNATFVSCLASERKLSFCKGTHYVFVLEGTAYYNDVYPLSAGMYGCFTDGYLAGALDTLAVVVSNLNYNGLMQIGGRIEPTGRLRYIDGCSDTLLVPPVKKGDPCLNLLHFPTGIKQTMHTHPSMRIGVVARGYGVCHTPFGDTPLVPNQLFVIKPSNGRKEDGLDGKQHEVGLHCFETHNREMQIIAYHPDSDWGATDEDHPMKNNTFIDGISARGQ
ncbi:MAG: cupin domain-containing protein [Betaproteobacteria bacterium]